MHFGKKIAIALLLLPLAELVGFGLVAWTIGLLEALALMVLTSVAGALVLRHAGRGQMAGLRTALRRNDGLGQVTGSAGFMVALGGILLLLPGFITDLAGACLLLGPVRRWLGATIGRAIERRRPRTGPGSVIDLRADEWRPVPDPEAPKRE
ncbi:MAG TPA: FxsA family protein [Xanthobacteraceae bacterium]|nr:FxsA family protein [Xanthobacteraceae bacterium]